MSQTGTQPWTIQRLLAWTNDYFLKHGRDVPRLAAEVLLAEALGCRRIELYTRFDEVPTEPNLSRFRDWVRRHAAGEPVAYLVGHKDFYSLRFKVTPDVLIPRPETELLILEALDALKSISNSSPIVVDVGTGSGCVAIAIAKHSASARILAMDVSHAALEVARENACANQVDGRIEFRTSDLLSELKDETPDIIISNPPYVGRAEIGSALENDVLNYEPGLALFGGTTGIELTERLIREAALKLAPGGFLIFETSPMLAADCVERVRATGKFDSCHVKKDLAKLDRVVIARKRI